MISAKLATAGFLQIKMFPNKSYKVMICDYDITEKISSRGSNYIVDVVMPPNFGKFIISMKKVIITSIL